MVQTCLFREEAASAAFREKYSPDTRIVWFWARQPRRLTDGYIAIPPGGQGARVVINWTSHGTAQAIAARAAYDEHMWRKSVGMTDWSDDRIVEVLDDLGIAPADGESAADAFVAALEGPVREAEREFHRPRLSIQWDIDGRDPNAAIDMRNRVTAKAEAILNDAGLLVDREGATVGQGIVEATLAVTEFNAAKSVLWHTLSAEERGHNFRILDGSRAI